MDPKFISEDVFRKKPAKLLFQRKIASLVEALAIPPSFIMNFDQTALKNAPVSSNYLAKNRSKHITIAGVSFEESITATSGAAYTNNDSPDAAHL